MDGPQDRGLGGRCRVEIYPDEVPTHDPGCGRSVGIRIWRVVDDVDALHEVLRRIGAAVLDPPADYPQYGEGYYAVFFADPDGLKLEFVFQP